MNPTMKNFQNSDVFQRFALFGLQATGSVVAVGIAVFLVLAWIVTSPFIHLVDRIAGMKK
jgi:hypothetical protein